MTKYKDVYLKKQYINVRNEEYLENEAFIAYIALMTIFDSKKSKYYISIDSLQYELMGYVAEYRGLHEKLVKGIELLLQYNLIEGQKIRKNFFELTLDYLYIKSKKTKSDKNYDDYVIIRQNEIHTIFSIGTSHNKISLLRYFVNLIGSIDGRTWKYIDDNQKKMGIVGYMTIDYLAEISGIAKSRAVEYNALLESYELIFIQRANAYKKSGKGIQNMRNHYGRLEDREDIIAFAEDYLRTNREMYVLAKRTKDNSNHKRRMKQYYNQMLAGKVYDEKTIKDIFNYVVMVNIGIERELADTTYDGIYEKDIEGLNARKLDESIFTKYGLKRRLTDVERWNSLPDDYYLDEEKTITKADYEFMFGDLY